jgi:SAM-dependent methyltransferase
MISALSDPVKEQVAAHWNRRAAHFDEDFGHSIRTPAERVAWDRILDLILPAAGALEALDIGCGTGFLSLELASRGHRVTGVDFAPSIIALARKKAAERQAAIRYEEADAEQLPFTAASFDVAVSQADVSAAPEPLDNARRSPEYAAIGDRLPFPGGWPREEIEKLFAAHRLLGIASDPFLDLVTAEEQRMEEEGLERRIRRRYAVWGDLPR